MKRDRAKPRINGIESFWSFAKMLLAKQRGVRAEKFPLRLKVSEWRWSHRRDNLYSCAAISIMPAIPEPEL